MPALQANPALEPAYARIVDQCLSKNPRHRPTCHELVELLQATETKDDNLAATTPGRSSTTLLRWGVVTLVALCLILLAIASF